HLPSQQRSPRPSPSPALGAHGLRLSLGERLRPGTSPRRPRWTSEPRGQRKEKHMNPRAHETGRAATHRHSGWLSIVLPALGVPARPPVSAPTAAAADSAAALAAAPPAPPAVEASPVIPGTVPGTGEVPGLQYFRPRDIGGRNVFEAPKTAGEYQGKKVFWGFGFVQQYQGLTHQNSADPNIVISGGQPVNTNQLIQTGHR